MSFVLPIRGPPARKREIIEISDDSEDEAPRPLKIPKFYVAPKKLSDEEPLSARAIELEEFDHDKEIQRAIEKAILANLCSDNMRGKICQTPDACMKVGFIFACPKYAFMRPCAKKVDGTLTHPGFKHTITGCHVDDNVNCKKRHGDGRPCRVVVDYYHVRAACASLRDGERCNGHGCGWGHDHEDVRKHVMTARRNMT